MSEWDTQPLEGPADQAPSAYRPVAGEAGRGGRSGQGGGGGRSGEGGGGSGEGGGGGDGRGGDRPDRDRPRGPWNHRVHFSTDNDGLPFAYRPHEVLTTRGEEAAAIADRLQEGDDGPVELAGAIGPFTRLRNVSDPLRLVEDLRLFGIVAQPNHVYFNHPVSGNPVYGNPVYGNPVYGNPVYGNPVYGNPVYGNPVYGNPVYGNPVYGNPVYGNPVYGNPVYGNPVYGNPVYGTPVYGNAYEGPKRSTALPPPEDLDLTSVAHRVHQPVAPGSPHVIVLDTGLAEGAFLPAALQGSAVRAASAKDTDQPDEDHDGYLDPAAGHGTFIAGVIAQIAPGCETTLHRVLSTFGDGDEWAIIDCLEDLLPLADPDRTVINLSFGGYVLDHPHAMAWAIRLVRRHGAQVVASAGNDASCRPSYPAALPGVVAVGAVCPGGPAPFTNWGPWVSASAPGSDVLSTFFAHFNGPAEKDAVGVDPDDFDGWAVWSGTSFSGPAVVGNLARIMLDENLSGADAVRRLLDPPAIMRIPNLGAIVNFL